MAKQKYTVIAIEKIYVQSTFFGVEADSYEEAEKICRSGDVGPSAQEPFDHGDDEWVETYSVELEIPPPKSKRLAKPKRRKKG